MNSKKNIFKKIVPHLLAWGAVLFVNLFALMSIFSHDSDGIWSYSALNIPIWILYLVLFYLNLYLLIPRLLFRSRYFAYCAIVFVLLTAASISVTSYKQYNFRERLKTSIAKESQRTDISVYKKNKNIKKIDKRIEGSYKLMFYNPFNGLNVTTTYGLLLIVVSGLTLAYITRWRKREEQVADMDKQRIESELAYLKQQINPHFLFNALNSIYSLVLPHSEQASDVVLKLSSILRYMLYETNHNRVALEKELEIMSDYIELQKLKCTPVTEITYRFEGDFNNCYIEPLMMIPLIENAFKYGVNNSTPSFIDILVEVKDHVLTFSIRNKIVVSKVSKEHSGIGIKNISRRLDIIYGTKVKYDFFAENDIFYVYLSVPLSSTLN